MQIVLDSKKFGIRLWWLNLALAVLTGTDGILLILRHMTGVSAVTVFFGVSCLAEGVLNLSTVLTSVKIIRHQVPNVIGTDDFEIHEQLYLHRKGYFV